MSPNKYWSTFIACAFKLVYLSMEKVSSVLILLPDYQKALAKKKNCTRRKPDCGVIKITTNHFLTLKPTSPK